MSENVLVFHWMKISTYWATEVTKNHIVYSEALLLIKIVVFLFIFQTYLQIENMSTNQHN